jgi:phosphate transport system substrate-binding protein
MMKRTLWTISLLAFAFCASVTAPQAGARELLEIVGTGDGLDIMRALAADYMQANGGLDIAVPPSIGSGGGIAAVGSGKSILGRVARTLTDAEREAGIVYQPIARLPSAFFVHPSAGIAAVTTTQLLDIYAGRVSNWKDVGGADLKIRVIRREDIDSTLVVLRASMPGWKDLIITDRSKLATSTQEAIETAREVPGAIGFAPYSKNLDQDLVVLKIDGRHPIDDGYPSNNILALIFSERTIFPSAQSFVRYAVGDRAKEIIKKFGSVPVSR